MNERNDGFGVAAPNSRKVLRTLCLAITIAGLMIGSSLAAGGTTTTARSAPAAAPNAPHLAPLASAAPYTFPTTTMQEPNYTGGQYVMGTSTDVEHLNVYTYSDIYSAMIIDEIYDSANNYAPNQTYIPWAASSWVESSAWAPGAQVFDPLTGNMQPVAYTYNVTLRPGIQWSDYTSANKGETYTYSNYVSAVNVTGAPYTYTYPWPSVSMNTETIQSADLILSWEILATSVDYSANWANIVDVRPIDNLTAEFYLSAQSATFVTTTLGSPILPYHVWQPHDFADQNPHAWNYTGTNAPNGYDSWDVGFDPATGTSNDLVGSGPFLFTNSYGQPQGQWIAGQYWKLYVNPYCFVQYVPSLRQWTPRIASIYAPLFDTESATVAALELGQVDTVFNGGGGVDPTFIPTVQAIPGVSIFYQSSGSFDYIQFNTFDSNAPFNITAFRDALNYATNKAYLASVVNEGYIQLGQPVDPIADSVWHNFSTPQYGYDPAQATSLINSIPGMTKNGAGNWLYDGNPVTANVQITVASQDPLGVEGALLIAEEWSAIGVPTTVTQEAFSTLVSNLYGINYDGIDLGISGIQGDPTSFFLDCYNSAIGTGTGYYEGPYSSLTWDGQNLNGTQVDSLMNNLSTEMNSITNFTQRLNIAYEIEGIEADESTLINLGYPVNILPFSNTTFEGMIPDSLSWTSFMYWNFMSFYEKSFHVATPPVKIPTQLHVGVVTAQSEYANGQFGNVTIQVRNQYGSPVQGMNVSVGYNPTGGLLNITSSAGLTNAQGQYTWEFQVLPANPLVYTDDYSGEINISVSATPPPGSSSTIIPGLGWTSISVAPQPIAYREITTQNTLVNGTAATPFTLEVYDPSTGAPVSGYSYIVEALSGAIELSSGATGQTVSNTTSYSPIRALVSSSAGFANVAVNNATYPSVNGTADYGLTVVTGVTGSNGLVTVNLAVNATVNWTAMGSAFPSWLFLGSYAAGAPLVGESPYALIAEITSSFDPSGFGADEPVEIPLVVAATAPTVDLNVAVTTSVNSTTTGTVTVTATNSTSGDPIPDYTVTVTSQNAEGANRGVIVNPAGTPVEAYTPNEYFGSTFIPGLMLETNATGVATGTFSPGLYTPAAAGGVFSGFTPVAFADPFLIPFDEFEIAAWGGATADVASAEITSNGTASSGVPTDVITTYLGGAGTLNGVTVVTGNATYPLYVNSTLNSPWGPVGSSTAVNLTTTLGTIAGPTGSTGTSGSYATTYSAPNVTTFTAVTIGIHTGVGNVATQTFYIVPAAAAQSTTPKTAPPASTTNNNELYAVGAVAAILGVLAAIFAVMWISGRGKQPPKPAKWTDSEDAKPGGTSTTSTTTTGGGTSGGGGSAPPS